MFEPASVGFQFLPSTKVTALVRDNNIEEWQLQHEIRQPECQAWASADYEKECCCTPPYLPLDLFQYYQSLYLLSVQEKEIGAHPAVTSSGPDKPPLQATTTTFQVGQGKKGDCCYIVKGTDNLSVAKKCI